ncbi:hypothetical protein GCM10007352_19720 [Mucilaginibacter phyllosphaerae]|nr:hypothetical protein GCM10007352_19720 [Mucilaginibacter phyllosphaerae]
MPIEVKTIAVSKRNMFFMIMFNSLSKVLEFIYLIFTHIPVIPTNIPDYLLALEKPDYLYLILSKLNIEYE